jgi:hypothetical protein
MALEGCLADEKLGCYFIVAPAANQERQHFDFAAGQGFASHARRQFFNERGRYARYSPTDFPDAVQQNFTSFILEQVAFCTRLDCSVDVIIGVKGRQDHEFR